MKRSSAVPLVLMGAVALSGCGDQRIDTAVFETVEQCIAAGNESLDCQSDFAAAEAVHAETAPAFASVDDCEADFGEGNCTRAEHEHAAGSGVFVPFMMGYMLGGVARGTGAAATSPQALYRTGGAGGFYNAAGAQVAGNTGPTTISAGSAAARTPNATTTTLARGGFGARAVSISS